LSDKEKQELLSSKLKQEYQTKLKAAADEWKEGLVRVSCLFVYLFTNRKITRYSSDQSKAIG
jgi:hypothetical protein